MAEAKKGSGASKPKKSPGLLLTERDFRILYQIHVNGFLTSEAIKLCGWKDQPDSMAHYRRIRKLVAADYIYQFLSPEFRSKGYRVTKKGSESLRSMYGKIGEGGSRSYRNQFTHDDWVGRVGVILHQASAVVAFRVGPEVLEELGYSGRRRIMEKYQDGSIPDALFDLDSKDVFYTVALEVEMTRKSDERYHDILRNQIRDDDRNMTLYVVKTENIRRTLLRIYEYLLEDTFKNVSRDRRKPIFFCLLDELQKEGVSACVTDGKDRILLRDLFQFSVMPPVRS